MRIIDRYILREIAIPAALAAVVISFLAVSSEFYQRIRTLDLSFVRVSDVLELYLYFLPGMLSLVAPVTFMMGILFAFGRLAQNNELTALRAAGLPLQRLILPVIGCGAVLSVGCFLLGDWAGPAATSRAYRLLYTELPLRATLNALPAGVMHEFGDWRVYFESKDPERRTLYKVDILIPQEKGRGRIFYAESASVLEKGGESVLVLRDGYIIQPVGEGEVAVGRFSAQSEVLPPLEPVKARGDRNRYTIYGLYKQQLLVEMIQDLKIRDAWNEATLNALAEHGGAVAEVEGVPESIRAKYPYVFEIDREWLGQFFAIDKTKIPDTLKKTRRDISRRLALPAACLALTLVAAPLAARSSRAGRSFGFAIGASLFLIYYLTLILVEPRGLASLGESILRAQTPNVLFAVTGAWLTWRVDRV